MTKLHQLTELGQAAWLDYIRRSFVASGGLQALVDQGLRGVTSNPTIFEKAIAGSTDYDADLQRLAAPGRPPEEIFQALAVGDIRAAADVLRPVYDQTGGADGLVSLEVSPALARDTEGTVAEARRLFAAVGRPNVMIKVPATPQGLPAITTLIGDGINVNVTLMFSLDHYEAVAHAYLDGLEKLAAAGGDPARVASVASFFVSRVDTKVDKALQERGAASLLGKIAIANSKLTYARFQEIFSGRRWQRLAGLGARVQRPLWASTSTKNPAYPDTIYVDNLIGPHTVNTLPQATLDAFLDHGRLEPTLLAGLDEARAHIARLAELGIDLDAITEELQLEGVDSFHQSYRSLLSTIADKQKAILAARPGPYEIGARPTRWADLGTCRPAVEAALAEMGRRRVIERLWQADHSLWHPDPAGVANRLGWLDAPENMRLHLPRLRALADAAQAAGYTRVLLLGMGGSSLAPEVYARLLGPAAGGRGLALEVLDSTVPGDVLAHAQKLDAEHTLFVVSTKSGTTIETLSLFKYFYNRVAEQVAAGRAGEHFVAVTDAGSKLAGLAERLHFRELFLNEPTIGGRYSALSFFGLVPAALVGVHLDELLDRAATMAAGCAPFVPPEDNLAAWLGAVLAEAAAAGIDKVTLVASPAIAALADWAEQLLAESTGKEGKGLVPIVGEPLRPPAAYDHDRLFVHLRLPHEAAGGDDSAGRHDAALQALRLAGHPVVHMEWDDVYDLGGQFFLWELATAVAGARLGINPFNQPNVEAAKILARDLVAEYTATGELPHDRPDPLTAETLLGFLEQARPGDYIATLAYLQPTAATGRALHVFRTLLRDRTRLATTVGYGPRYLHSTGQLHKGDAGRGLFIMLTADDPVDVPIPDEPGKPESALSFGTLKLAQALGDRQALRDAGRRVIHLHLADDTAGGLRQLSEALLHNRP